MNKFKMWCGSFTWVGLFCLFGFGVSNACAFDGGFSIGMLASLAGAAASVAGSVIQAKQQEAQAENTADILEYNKRVSDAEALSVEKAAEADARAMEEAGKAEAAKFDRQRRIVLGQYNAGLGASGFLKSGTHLAMLADMEREYRLDAAQTMYNVKTEADRTRRTGEMSASKLRSQGTQYGMSAAAQNRVASGALPTSLLTGVTSALSSLGQRYRWGNN